MAVQTQTTSIQLSVPVEPSQHREPLKLSGALEDQKYFDVTPIIGREFPTANVKEWLEAPNSDELIRDLAITSEYISRIQDIRG
jgi:hypothetical protein